MLPPAPLSRYLRYHLALMLIMIFYLCALRHIADACYTLRQRADIYATPLFDILLCHDAMPRSVADARDVTERVIIVASVIFHHVWR